MPKGGRPKRRFPMTPALERFRYEVAREIGLDNALKGNVNGLKGSGANLTKTDIPFRPWS